MSMHPAEMFPDLITYALPSGVDVYGAQTYAAAVAGVAALVVEDLQVIRTVDEEEVVTSHRVSLETALPEGARVWLAATEGAVGDALFVRAAKSSSGFGFGILCEARVG